MLAQMLIELGKVDKWLDDSVSDAYKRQPMAQDWARISKIAEELGEVIDAWIIHTGQNPRKAHEYMMPQVLNELADVALTAILCMLHFTKDESETGAVLMNKVQSICRRMVNAQVTANRTALRDSNDAMQAQRNFAEAMNDNPGIPPA